MKTHRYITIFLCLLLLISIQATSVFAIDETADDYPDALVIPYFSTSYIKNRADILDSFDTPTSVSLWTPSLNVDSVSAETSFADCPFDPVEGSRCLNAVGSNVNASSWRYIERVYDEPLDLSSYSSILLAISVRRLSDADYTASVTLVTEKNTTKRYTVTIEPECWNGIILDISELVGRESIKKIRVGVQHDYGDDVNYSYNFQLDCLAASTDRYLARTAVFMSGSYLVYGGESKLVYGYDPLKMTVEIASTLASRCFIESGALTEGIFSSCEAIKLRMVNNSDCDSITLEYSTVTQPDYLQNTPITLAIEDGSDIQSLYFNIPSDQLTQLRLTFNNVAQGEIDIYSLTPASYYSAIDSAYSGLLSDNGALTSCRISDDGKKLIIKGTMTDSAVTSFKSSRIELYELQPYMANEYIFSTESEPVATTSISTDFEFELSLYDGERSRIASRFAAVVYNRDKARTILLGSPRYITNPEAIAIETSAYPDYISKKGIISDAATLLDVGAAYTELTLNYGHLLTTDPSGIEYVFEGKTYYFNRSYVDVFTDAIKDANIAGCAVNLRMVLTKPSSPDYALTLIHPGALSRSTAYYAANTESEEGISALKAVTSFIAEYWMSGEKNCRAVGLIFGGDIDTAYYCYNMGKQTCRDFSDSYTRAFRVVYNTVRSTASKAKIYISIGNSWDGLRPSDAAVSYLGSDLCDLIAAQMIAEGNISWQLAVDPYANNKPLITDLNGSDSLVGSSISFRNLPALCSVFSRHGFIGESGTRGITVSHFSAYTDITNTTASIDYAAEYCYALCTVMTDDCASIDSLMLPYFRDDVTLDMIKYVDTDNAGEFASALKNYYGVTELNELIPGYRPGMTSGRIVYEGEWSEYMPDSIRGSALIATFTDENDLIGWTTSSALTSLSVSQSFKGYQNMAFAQIGGDNNGIMLAISNLSEYPRDLSYAPYLSFNCYTDNISPDIHDLTLTVTCLSGINRAIYRGRLTGGMWSYVIADLTGFTDNRTIDTIMIQLSSETDELDGATLVVGELRASSTKYESDYLETKFREERDKFLSSNKTEADNKIVWMLISIIITALTIELVYIMSRLRVIDIRNKKYEESKKYRY